MKKGILTFLFSIFTLWAVACSCNPFYSFCEYKSILNPDLILSAEIIDTNQYGIRLKKIDLIEGTELRDTIPVWNDTNFYCTGTVSMRATQIGAVGDTVIVMLPRIDSVYTTWGVLGDYRTPMHLCGRAFIKIENDSLTQSPNVYLQGNQPPYLFVEKPSYQDFITYLNQYGDCDDLRKGDFAYKPFPEALGTYWIEERTAMVMGMETFIQNRITKDTVINGLEYQRIDQNIKDILYNPNPIVTYSNNSFGYIRNDSANKKVWARLANNTSDTLLFDFNLSLGKKINVSYIIDTTFIVNQVIDSISFHRFGDGVLRKQFFFNNGGACGPNILIEGIGLSSGTFFPFSPCLLESRNQLECLYHNNKTVYPDSIYFCNQITGINDDRLAIQAQLSVFPNPIQETFQIDSPIAFESIQLYNNKGQLIKSLSTKNENWKLNGSSGIYFLRFETKDGQLFHKKIIKH